MRSIRIGTRKSPLAMWQAQTVAQQLETLGFATELVPVVSSGDKNLQLPLYALGITGVFTRDLDIALLNKEIDLAVHSLKDIPTQLPQNVQISAVLERDFPADVLVRSAAAKNKELPELTVATSSLRRRAFWLKEMSGTPFTDIRGNVQTRLQKLEEGIADATLFSLAGLKRLKLEIPYEELPFMLPAPAQGVIAVTSRVDDEEISSILKNITHHDTELCITVEREFLQTLEGGCTAPIGAFAEIEDGKMRFVGRLCSLDGENSIETDEIFDVDAAKGYGKILAQKVLENGGAQLMAALKNQL